MDIWIFGSVLSKFGLYVGVLFAVGTVFYQYAFETESAAKALPMRNFALGMIALGLCAAILSYGIRAASLTGNIAAIFDPRVLKILWTTPVGTVLVLRVIGLACLVAGQFLKPYATGLGILGGLITLASFTQIGHVTNFTGIYVPILLLAHLLCLSLWLGILLPLYRLSVDTEYIATVAKIGRHFGQFAVLFVPIVIIAGTGLGYFLLGSWYNIVTTAYGQVLVLKVFLVMLLLVLAAVNKWHLVPKIVTGDCSALRHFRYSVLLEILIVLGVLLATTFLTSLLDLPLPM